MDKERPGVLFAGQGAQAVGMGKSFLAEGGAARRKFDEADEILGWPLSRIILRGPEDELRQTRVCQPALFVHGLVVFEELVERGVIGGPSAVAGLSLGELTALVAAGAMDFETGLRLVAERGRLMQEACEERGGSMASVIGGSREAVAELCEQSGAEMANLNCPGQIVVSGTKEAIREAVVLGKDKGFKLVKELAVAGAYHSRLMEPARERFAGPVAEATIREPLCPFFANVSGREVRGVAEIRESLVAQIVSPVLFEDCLRSMAAGNGDSAEFVECGPGRVLAGLVRRTDRSWNVRSFADLEDFAGGE